MLRLPSDEDDEVFLRRMRHRASEASVRQLRWLRLHNVPQKTSDDSAHQCGRSKKYEKVVELLRREQLNAQAACTHAWVPTPGYDPWIR